MFTKQVAHPVDVWAPDPDDQAAHDWLLEHFQHMGLPFVAGPLSTRVQGNLGEAACMLIGASNDFNGFNCFAANAHQPLQDISRSEMDIVWIHLAGNPADDYAILQEVKTTGGVDLAYADSLVADYGKLFNTDPALTLTTRLSAVANAFEYGMNDVAHADGIRGLASLSPQATVGVTLLPSIVYDRGIANDPGPKMAAVRQSVIALGWAPDAVTAWAVGLGDLLDRLSRLKAGLN